MDGRSAQTRTPKPAGPDPQGRSDRSNPADRSRRARVLIGIVVLTLLLVVGWLVAVGVSARAAAQDLQTARDLLVDAQEQLRNADLVEARDNMRRATVAADAATDRLARPHVRPVRHLPLAGPNLDAAETLAGAVGSVGGASAEVLDVVLDELQDDASDDAGGRIPMGRIEELAPAVRRLAVAFDGSVDAVTALDANRLVQRVVDARERYLEVAAANVDAVVTAADVLEVLPGLLGADGPRVYLVGAGALSELRGSGGLLGSWAVLTVDDGDLLFDDFVDVDDLPVPDGRVTAPSEDFERRYGRYAALSTWRSANISPDFPAAAQVMMQLYEDGGGAPVDGVIVADTVVFQRLAERSGGLRVQGVGFLDPEETLQFVGLDAYAEFDDESERKRVLGAAATAAFTELFDALGGDDLRATAQLFTGVAQGGHLQVHVRDEQAQAALEQVGVAGGLPTGEGESFGLSASNFAQNKVDYFTELDIDHAVRLAPDGVTHGTVAGRLHNDAPQQGYPRDVLGPWLDDVEPGDNVSLITASCSRSCRFATLPDGAVDGGSERGRAMSDALVHLPAGDTGVVRYETRSEGGWRDADGGAVLEVEHLVQPRIRPTTLRVRVDIPAGFEAAEVPDGATIDASEITWEDRTSGRVRLVFRFVPSPNGG